MVPRDERMEKVFQTNGTINKQSVTVLTPSRASQRPKGSHFIYGNNLSRGHDNSQFPCTQLICAAISQTKTAKCKIRDRTEIGLGRSACHTAAALEYGTPVPTSKPDSCGACRDASILEAEPESQGKPATEDCCSWYSESL